MYIALSLFRISYIYFQFIISLSCYSIQTLLSVITMSRSSNSPHHITLNIMAYYISETSFGFGCFPSRFVETPFHVSYLDGSFYRTTPDRPICRSTLIDSSICRMIKWSNDRTLERRNVRMAECSNDRMVDPSIYRNTISYFPFRLISFYYSTVDNSVCRFVNRPLDLSIVDWSICRISMVDFRFVDRPLCRFVDCRFVDLSIIDLSICRFVDLSLTSLLRSRQQFPVNLAVSTIYYIHL